MKNRDRVLLGLVLICGLVLRAGAQTAVSPAWRTLASLDDAQSAAIGKFVQENLIALEGKDPDAVRQAREALVERTSKPGTADLSVAFGTRFAEAVNTEALALLARSKAIRTQLNVAIIVARIAENTRSAKLEPVILKLLDDAQSEVIKLWGVRAGRSIIPSLIPLNAEAKVVDGIMRAVKAHPVGAMTQEGYAALTSEADSKVAVKVVQPLLALVRARAAVMTSKLPEEPGAEGPVFVYLTNPKVWNELPQAQRVEIIQLMADTIVLLARHGDAAAMDVRQEVVGSINRMAQGGMVVFQLVNFPPAVTVFTKIYNGSKGVGVKLVELTKDLHATIRQAPGFQAIKDPPAAGAPASAVVP